MEKEINKTAIREEISSLSQEELRKRDERFNITITDNISGEVIKDVKSNLIIGVICSVVEKDKKKKTTELEALCLTSCDTKTLLGALKGLDKIQRMTLLEMLKGSLKELGGLNE